MSIAADGTSSRVDRGAPLVISRRRRPLVTGLVAVVLVIALVGWLGLASSSVVAYVLSIGVAAALGVLALVLAVEVRRASTPLLVADADADGLTTGPAPSVRVAWEETDRVVVLDRGSRGAALGIVPVDLGALLTRSRPRAGNTREIATMLEKRQRSDGAPLVVSLRLTGVDAAEAARRLTALSAGRTTIAG